MIMNSTTMPEVESSGTLDIGSKLGSLLEEYGEITTILPVLAGLFVTSRMQLRGASALLVNLAIAAITRQMVAQLKKQAHQTNGDFSQKNQSEEKANPAEDYTIVHSVPGRIRLRIPRLMTDAIYAKHLEKVLSADQRVMRIRLNRSAASLVIQYDGAGVSELELGMRLLQILAEAENGATTNSVYNSGY